MEIEEQACSLELARKLKVLATPQKSLFYWARYKNCVATDWKDGQWFLTYKPKSGIIRDTPTWEICSAFTVAELGELLPAWIKNPYRQLFKTWKYNDGLGHSQWGTYYEDDFAFPQEDFTPKLPIFMKTEANSRATMLIYLIENKLISFV